MESETKDPNELSPSELLLAATYIDDAKARRNINFRSDHEKYVRAYVSYNFFVWKYLLFFCIWANLALAIFEDPAIEGFELPYYATMIFEAAFLMFFFARLMHHAFFEVAHVFWRDTKNLTILAIIILTTIDIICYISWKEAAAPEVARTAVRWSRPLRPLYLINFPQGRQIRKAFRNIRRTLPDIFHVLVLFICSIAMFALLATKLFDGRNLWYPNGAPYMPDFWEAFWDLYTLVTTANNPDVMMPAYDYTAWSSLFFIVYLIVNLYLFMSIVLAVIYNNYKNHLKNEVRLSVYVKRRKLLQAFELLKQASGRDHSEYTVSTIRWQQLMRYMYPRMSGAQIELYFNVLTGGEDHIKRSEFLAVADLLLVPLGEVRHRTVWLQSTCPALYLSYPSQLVCSVVSHRFFRYTFDVLIVANAVCMIFNFEEGEWFFLSAFTLEILLKIYCYGPVKFFTNLWDVFDFVVIMSALLATLIELFVGLDQVLEERTLDLILVLRVLRLIRLAGSVQRFEVIITTVMNVAPSILTYGGVIFVFYYIYGIIGMECFKNRIRYFGYNATGEQDYCGDPALKGTEFFSKHYCNNNFNDIARSLVILFELMVVNQWHVLANGFVLVTSKAARLYFISFHMVVVIIILNIFTAFVLEVFMIEYNLSRTQLETTMENRIKDMGLGEGQKQKPGSSIRKKPQDKDELVEESDFREIQESTVDNEVNSNETKSKVDSDAGMRFQLKKNSRKRVEVILQHMFEDEIDPKFDSVDVDFDQFQAQNRPRRLTLDNVT